MFVAKCETLKDKINSNIKYPGWNSRKTNYLRLGNVSELLQY